MKIVIVGDGKVGFTLAAKLDVEGHDVTIIENKPNVLTSTLNMLDVIGIQGNGANYDVQMEAKVPEADLLIAATSTDEMNMICCMIAKKLGARHTIARIRNPEYIKTLSIMKEDLGLSMHINPEFAAAREISRTLRFSDALKVNFFAKSRVELIEVKIHKENPLIGVPLHAFNKKHKLNVLVCALQRGEDVIIPDGNAILQENDRIHITGSPKDLEKFFYRMDMHNRKVKDVIIIGGGRIAFYLTQQLLDMGMHVKIVEKNKDRCLQLLETFPDATIIHGDGTDHELLISENLKEHDAFIALTDNDEENIIISMYAASNGVKRVIPKINRISMGFLLEKLGLENAVTPKYTTADQIVQYVRAMQNTVGSNVESLIRLLDDQVEVLEFRVRKNCKFINVPLVDLQFQADTLAACITHRGITKIAKGSSRIQEGDTIIIISKIQGLRELNDVLL